MTELNRRVVLRARPKGPPRAEDFAIDSIPVPEPGEGQFVVRNLYASLDPGIRQRLSQVDSYVKLIGLGEPLTSTTLGIVTASREPRAAVGDHVVGFHTVSDFSLASWGPLTRIVDLGAAASPTNHLSLFGMPGLTAYFGLLDVGRPQAGETVLVSAAAGAVGSIAAQIAKLKGCRVVGVAGGAEKCASLLDEFGLDAAIDYRGKTLPELTAAVREAAPAGVDLFFDNVGGVHLDAALDCLNPGGRIALCGLIAQYNATEPPAPLTNLFKLIAKSARIEGFVVLSYAERFPEALAAMHAWQAEGKLAFREHVEEGIERAVPAFLRLFDGSNRGKMIVKLAL
jgi:NADPH-dependent curcumin reductase CurA